MGSLSFDVQEGVSRLISAAPPTHYNLKINNFSSLAKNSIDRYESGEFQAGGYKWKLVVYPNGNKNKNEKEHVSVYLAMVKENSLPTGWQVYAKFSLFLLDQNNDNYMVLRLERERQFHRSKLEWGFDKFISLKAFNEASNGFLVDDTCEFGAEVLVCKERSTGKGECVSMIKDPIKNKHVWRVWNFSKLVAESYDSQTFYTGDHRWKIKLYPIGRGTIRWFSASDYEHGWYMFMTLFSFNYDGFLIKDTCIIEAEVTVHGVANAL
ncbi:hypothetical protein FEM48_Zijuj12G0129200 [Ziziphus jujuba var. spinosa]|uniref:MATH domain-containing protein n=1 Tax=Ziziphus jujuba var. spinosa TaxID=714518 RepID=A0A978UDG4_ZIZJJ|nr:hypothetical protein FEM48_Zijuj12G0129200 [Ziziphus jujuba var. spinosa]